MKYLIAKLTENSVVGCVLRVFTILVGIVMILGYWVYDLVTQFFCPHPEFEMIPDDDFIYCVRCDKEFWTPFNVDLHNV